MEFFNKSENLQKIKSFENSLDKEKSVGLYKISDTKNGTKFALIAELAQLDFISAKVVK